MRWSVVLLVLAIVAGCDFNSASTPKNASSSTSSTADKTAKAETASLHASREQENDKLPPEFDPADGRRTLRWIAALTDNFRHWTLSRTRSSDQKVVLSSLSKCLKQTIRWQVPVESVGADGKILFAPFRLTKFPDRSDQRPEITLQLLPWNKPILNPLFDCPPQPWLSNVRAGQDTITVQGVISGITFKDAFIWYISLIDVHFSSEANPTIVDEQSPVENFAPDDADKSFAWIRQQCYVALDPSLQPPDRKQRTQILHSELRKREGTVVRWQWPTAVVDDNAVTLQTVQLMDYPKQLVVKTGVLLKQLASRSGKAPQSSAPSAQDYSSNFIGSPMNKLLGPDVTRKIRESKKSTVRGKISKILAADYGVFPPSALEIAVRLDDAVVEP
jgi:hypothetical protein